MRRLAFCVLATIPILALLLCDIPAATLPAAADDDEVLAFLDRPQPPAPPHAEPLPPPEHIDWVIRGDPPPHPSSPEYFAQLNVESTMAGSIPITRINGKLYRSGDMIGLGLIVRIEGREVEIEMGDSSLVYSISGSVRITKDGETAQRIMQLRAAREADAEAACPPPTDLPH